jgi:hypothetical protein
MMAPGGTHCSMWPKARMRCHGQMISGLYIPSLVDPPSALDPDD